MRLASIALCFTLTASAAKAPAQKKPTAKSAKSRKAVIGRPRAAAAVPQRVVTPQTPSPERYKEIQQALASKGYLQSEPDGVWDAESSAALKQFQSENGLSETGKLSAASLIKLGLGGTPPQASTPAPPVPAPPSTP